MSIEKYIQLRDLGKTPETIQKEYYLTSAMLYTMELSYQCYQKALPLEFMTELAKRLKKYRHNKGPEYWALGDFQHTETNEVFKGYFDKDIKGWARPLEMFNGFVGDVPRFTEVLLAKQDTEKE